MKKWARLPVVIIDFRARQNLERRSWLTSHLKTSRPVRQPPDRAPARTQSMESLVDIPFRGMPAMPSHRGREACPRDDSKRSSKHVLCSKTFGRYQTNKASLPSTRSTPCSSQRRVGRFPPASDFHSPPFLASFTNSTN